MHDFTHKPYQTFEQAVAAQDKRCTERAFERLLAEIKSLPETTSDQENR